MTDDEPPFVQLFLTEAIANEGPLRAEIITIGAPFEATERYHQQLAFMLNMNLNASPSEPSQGPYFIGPVLRAPAIELLHNFIDQSVHAISGYDDISREEIEAFANAVVKECQLPVIHSPLKGVTLEKLAGGGAAGIGATAVLVHPDFEHILIYFMVIGVTPVVVHISTAVGKGIGAALEMGLRKTVLRLFGLESKRKSTSSKRKKPPEAEIA